MLRKRIYSLATFLWLVIITTLSLMSFRQDVVSKSRFPWARRIIRMISDIPNIDKCVHFVFYFVLGILLMQAMRREIGRQNSFSKNAFITFVIVVSIGTLIEFIQAYATSDRSGDVKDALANTLGTVVAISLLYIVDYIKK